MEKATIFLPLLFTVVGPVFDLREQWECNVADLFHGIHGKVKPHFLTKYIEVYISNYKGDWESWPTLRLHFKQGILQEYESHRRWAP